jgi:hypothetical protein
MVKHAAQHADQQHRRGSPIPVVLPDTFPRWTDGIVDPEPEVKINQIRKRPFEPEEKPMAQHDMVAGPVTSRSAHRRLGRDKFVMLALTGCLAILAARLAAPPIVFLLTSLVLLTAAAGIALGAWMHGSQRDAQGVSAWDVAGLLMLLGFAAGIAGDPMEMLASVEMAEASAR